MNVNSKNFRHVLGKFATGVTVVTTLDSNQQAVGLTANSFSSLSLDPPLILWSIARSSSHYRTFKRCDAFAIHILSADQEHLSRRFSSKANDRFHDLSINAGFRGVPLIENTLARLECEQVAAYEGGDHVILVGEVKNLETNPDQPLVFFDGQYNALTNK